MTSYSIKSISRNEESSSDDGWEIINNESSDDVPPSPSPPITTAQRNTLPPKKKQQPRGNGLTLKKGRRSVHRYMEEKNLFQRYLEYPKGTYNSYVRIVEFLNLLHFNVATSKKKDFLMIIQKVGTLAIATQNLIFHHSLMEITKVF